MEKLVISEVKADSNIAQVIVKGVKDEPGCTLKIVKKLAEEGIVIDMILQSAARYDCTALVLIVDRGVVEEAVDVLEANRASLDFEAIEAEKNVSKITLSGTGLMSHSDIVPRVLSCFYASNAPMEVISTSEIAIKVFTDDQKVKRVVDKIRDEFVDYGL